ncbi:MAG TPA: TIGR00730 family Rossman fold protein [Terriglobia bacterium]|nr:TIGR00730 family Rossman fold protein [Terriglobia bacterium]
MSKKEESSSNSYAKLAYNNERFLSSAEARTIRILSEYLEPQVRLRRAGVQNTVVLFGSARILPRDVALERLRKLESSRDGSGPQPSEEQLRAARMAVEMSRYYEEARELAFLITRWSQELNRGSGFLVVCSGGGPGIMEAANRGASEAGGKSIGLNIMLPKEQEPNPYITPELSFTFHYFFMRKLWFAQPAKSLIVFPGGFGTMDELWEFLTLVQTGKMGHRAAILLYGSDYWKRAINFEWMRETGTIDDDDMSLVHYVDSPQEAFSILKEKLKRDRTLRSAFSRRFF